ncbi:uncharacterized protein LOC135489242 [Lineus longissimus]|uniref:uncharacterized protein LOC135489242 n=1 Tax=Lineus longissimus TaxID=88925 RepID=UPI002B4F5B8D
MKLFLVAVCCVFAAMAMMVRNAEGIDALRDMFERNRQIAESLARDGSLPDFNSGSLPGFNSGSLPGFNSGSLPGFSSGGADPFGGASARAGGRGGKGKVFQKLMKGLRDLIKKQTENQKKDPEIPDGPPERLGGNDRDDHTNRRPAIERTGPFGREHKIPGTGGREIEGAFHGDRTGAAVQHVPSSRDSARDRGDRNRGGPRGSNDRGRSHRERGSSGRSIEH